MLHVVLQFFYQFVASLVLPVFVEHHRSLDNHAADVVGNACYGTLYDSRMGHQRTLDLERPDAVAAALDYVVDAPFKPVVAVFVAPRHVAGVVNAVVPYLFVLLLVAVIPLEKSYGLALVGMYHNLTLLSVLARRAVRTHQVDVILRIGHAHAARLRRHPRHRSERHRRLGLAEALHQTYARELQEFVIHRRVECLSCRTTVAQG